MTLARGEAQPFLIALASLQTGIVSMGVAVEAGVEEVTFPEGGGSSDLGLAIPYLPDMDDVVVDEAELTIRAVAHPVAVQAPRLEAGASGATIIDLGAPAQLVSLDITLDAPLSGDARVVLSAAESGAPEAPIFASPTPARVSDLYPVPLAGMYLSQDHGDARLTFDQPVAGRRWAIRVASGATAGELAPVASPTVKVRGVEVDAAPTGLTVVIPGDAGAEDAVLYANPGTLLPAAEPHPILFTPLAQRHLQRRLAAAREHREAGLLSLPIRLSSTTSGAVGIVSRNLRARYRVRISPEPPELATGGDWATLPLTVPAGRRPTDGGATLVAKLAGRELDPAFAPPPTSPPAAGVTVGPRRRVAAAASLTVPTGGGAALVAVRVLAAADRPAEVVLELRADAAGLPGTPLATLVRRVVTPGPAWQEFLLPVRLDLDPPARVWCVLRTNDEPVRWFCSADGEPPLLSVDDGASWGAVATPLAPGGAPLLQLFRPSPAGETPALECHLGSAQVAQLALEAGDGREASVSLGLPAQVLTALASTAGEGRVTTPLRLYSRTVMRLTVRDLACSYDPFAS